MKQTYSKTSYSEKLKDPRWQKLRLEVMNRSGFHCEICMNGSQTLHVHHKEYFKGREVWEYDKSQLACICEDCHTTIHSTDDFLKLVCSYAPLDGPGNRDEIAMLIAGHLGIGYENSLKLSPWEDCVFPKAAYITGEGISKPLGILTSELYNKYVEDTRNVKDGV